MVSFTDDGFRAQDVKFRIQQSHKALQTFLEKSDQYDLTPLAQLTNSASTFQFSDLSGTQQDFEGADFNLVTDSGTYTVQDKRRISSFGTDAQFEFVRMYRALHNDQCVYALDGGRDLCRIPQYLDINHTSSGWFVKRDWQSTMMSADLYLLHAVQTDDMLWFRYSVIKEKAHQLYHQWVKIYHESEEIQDQVNRNVFVYQSKPYFNKEFDANFDIRGIREVKDKKRLRSINGSPTNQSCSIAKLICYLPFRIFEEGKDFVKCPRKI